MGIRSSLKKVAKSVGNLVGSAVGIILSPVTYLLNALIDIPKPPKSIEAGGKQYNVDARINEAALGDVKTVVYGQVRDWPRYCSQPYTEYEGHDQILNAYLFLTVGYANVLDVRIGDTSASNFPGFELEVCSPGEDMTLILPNVYTCEEVSGGIELLGGALENSDVTNPNKIVTVNVLTDQDVIFANVGSNGQATASEAELFADFLVGDFIGVYDSIGSNDGDYTITAISNDYRTITVTPTFPTTGTASDSGFFVKQRWAGPYPACPPGSQVYSIALDFVFNALQNMGGTNDERTVVMVVQARTIDDVGNPLGAWEEGEFSFTDNVNRPRRYTVEFIVDSPARYEARVWRQTYEQRDQPDDPSSASQWVGLKGYIEALPVDDPVGDSESTRCAVRIRSSGQLSSATQRAVNVLMQRLLPIYESGFSVPQSTSNPVWAAVDWLINQSNGAITEADFDWEEVITLAEFADSNGDTFDGVFDRQVGLWEGAKTLLRVVRAKPIWDPITRLYTVYRDEEADPIQMFCDGFHARCGTDTIKLPDADTVTGIRVRFTDPFLWAQREGPIVGSDDDPRIVDFMGCTTWDKAWDEAQYEYRDLYYRTQSFSLSTEMEGLLPRHGKRVLVCSNEKGWGQSFKVIEEVDATTLKVWPMPVWTAGQSHYIYLQDEDGTPVGPIGVSQGVDGDNYLALDSDPGITIRDGAGWKTLVAFGHDGDTDTTSPNAPRVAIVMDRKANSQRTATLDLLIDNAFVHADPGAAPADPYSLSGTIPDLSVTGLTAELIEGGVILDEDSEAILDETGEALLEESGTASFVIDVDWNDVSGATYYTMRWKMVGEPGWHYDYNGIASETSFGVDEDGTYRIRVKAQSGSYIGTESEVSIVVSGIPAS